MFRSCLKSSSVSSAPKPAAGRPGENRDRVDEALVEDAEHDVDHEDRERQHPARGPSSSPGTPAPSPGSCPTPSPAASRAPAACTRATASPSATPGRRLNDSVTDGSCPVWLTDSGPTVWRVVTTAESGTSLPPRRLHVEHRQRRRVALVLRRHLQDHLVLVVGREDLRHLPRAVRRGQRQLHLVHREAERRDLVAVEVDGRAAGC